jgi:hypothetical protein
MEVFVEDPALRETSEPPRLLQLALSFAGAYPTIQETYAVVFIILEEERPIPINSK